MSFHSRVFYIRQSDERVDLGEIVSFKSEYEADLDLTLLDQTNGSLKSLESVYRTKKLYLEVQMCFKEASSEEIASHEKVKLKMSDKDIESF